ncbi:hypothetical protein [Bacillus sp. FSL M8-0168]|uniref:hypothetical protein n=1 Tax=Bacillus sp. FSL M8-0168 TaxID=2921614 RepID=UPI0030FD4B56
MPKLITVQRAYDEIKRLQHYIELAETYEADTLGKWIIKEYAYTNSITEVVKRANSKGFTYNGAPLDKQYVTSIISGKATDELHRLLRSGYRLKIKPHKRVST